VGGGDWVENQNDVSSNNFYVSQDDRLWIVSLLLQLLSEQLNYGQISFYLWEKGLPQILLNRRGLEIAQILLREIEKLSIRGITYYPKYLSSYDNIFLIKMLNRDLEINLGRVDGIAAMRF